MTRNQTLLKIPIAVGVASTAYYFGWWFHNDRLASPALVLLLICMAVYLATQAFSVWYIYLHAGKKALPSPPPAEIEYTVDVYLPTYNEPPALIEKTLRAALAMEHPHTTYVIDDGADDAVRDMALSLGARYIRRSDTQDYKAGNINNALGQSSGELVAVFDIDHIPDPDFLSKVVPYFGDPQVGVVQVALDHYNLGESFVSAAAGRMNDEFFAATMHGMDQLGSAVVFGSNAVFRRKALLALGGYKPGLAEDLNTSIHLHADGWKSAYAPFILAKGLVPADLDAFYKQQFKWARGVFDVLLREMPRLSRRLTGRQKICYGTRMTYYLAGPVIAGHIALTIIAPYLWTSLEPLSDYLLRSIPFLLSYVAIHVLAYRTYALKPVGSPVDLRGAFLVLASWPVYSLALLSALFRREPKFAATPKSRARSVSLRLVLPQLAAVALMLGSLFTHIHDSTALSWQFGLLVFVLVLIHSALIPATFPPTPVTNRGGSRS